MTYPVCKTGINKVSSLSSSVIEDDVKTFKGINLKSYGVPALLTFNGCHCSAGPRIGNGVYDPNVKVYVSPFGGVVINGKIFLAYGRKLINNFSLCLAANGAGTCLETGCLVCRSSSNFPFAKGVTESGDNFLSSYDCAALIVSANLAVSKTCLCAGSRLTGNNDCACVLAINVALKSANVTFSVKLVVIGMSLNGNFCLFNQRGITNRAFRTCCETCGSTGGFNCRYGYGSMIGCRNNLLCLENLSTNVTMRAFSETCGGAGRSNGSISCYCVSLRRSVCNATN